jgi:hypothetical protein
VNDLAKVMTATRRNGVDWLQEGLARKYGGATIDFNSDRLEESPAKVSFEVLCSSCLLEFQALLVVSPVWI